MMQFKFFSFSSIIFNWRDLKLLENTKQVVVLHKFRIFQLTSSIKILIISMLLFNKLAVFEESHMHTNSAGWITH